MFARRWRISPGTSSALLQAVAKNREAKSEEAVALAALGMIPNHLSGDEGWAAVRTAVHSADPELVLHLAAQPLVRRSLKDPLTIVTPSDI